MDVFVTVLGFTVVISKYVARPAKLAGAEESVASNVIGSDGPGDSFYKRRCDCDMARLGYNARVMNKFWNA